MRAHLLCAGDLYRHSMLESKGFDFFSLTRLASAEEFLADARIKFLKPINRCKYSFRKSKKRRFFLHSRKIGLTTFEHLDF